MAVNDAIMSRLGVVNATSDGSWPQDNAMFLQVFSGEVLTAFEETNVMKDLHLMRTITEGKSASFPATWKAKGRYHVPGNPILGSNKIKANERIIKIDDLLIADAFIYHLDEAKNHYDVRSIYTKQLGAALAREFDKKTMQVAVLAARAAATITEDGSNSPAAPGGTVLKNTSAATDGEVLAGMMFGANQVFDEKDIPEADRYVILRPAQYYLLAQTTKVINLDWGGSGVYADGTVLKVGGLSIVKSNNMPNANIAASIAGENNDYHGDFTNTVGIAFQKSAIGTVKLNDLTMQMTGNDFEVMYQGTLMVAKYAMGHGILRPECAVELSKAS